MAKLTKLMKLAKEPGKFNCKKKMKILVVQRACGGHRRFTKVIEGGFGSTLSSEYNAAGLMGCDMQGCVLAEGVVARLPFQHALITAAGVTVCDADLVDVGARVLVHRVEQSYGRCVRGCACCDGMDRCQRRARCARRSGSGWLWRRAGCLIGKPGATDE